MEATFDYTSATFAPAQDWAREQSRNWGVSTPYLSGWLQNGGDLLGDTDTGRAVLCFDPAERLLSLDIWSNGKRVFGMDDLV